MALQTIPNDAVLFRMRQDNPWWQTGEIPEPMAAMESRLYLRRLVDRTTAAAPRRAVVLMGQRRIGKTVLMYHAIRELLTPRDLDERPPVEKHNIFYLPLDTPLYSGRPLEDLLRLFAQARGNSEGEPAQNEKLYVFFDEIQYLKDWDVHLKALMDAPAYRHIQFVVSGSAGAALRRGSQESGAGRFTDFYLPPLTFFEYCQLRPSGKIAADETDADVSVLNSAFEDYLQFGGYPELAFAENPDVRRYGSDVVEKVLLRDLPALYGISDVPELNRLFNVLAYNSGQEISLDALSQSSHVAKNTLQRYLEYLEAAFLIYRLERVDDTAQHFKRARRFKIYLTNPAMRTALFGTPLDEDWALLVEAAILSQMDLSRHNMRYASWNDQGGRAGGEVDFVELDNHFKPVRLVEAKWTDRFVARPNELASLRAFCQTHRDTLQSVIVTTKTLKAKQHLFGVDIDFIPAAETCFNMRGRHITRPAAPAI
jgi:predicted AAA+ superfamily ATPase